MKLKIKPLVIWSCLLLAMGAVFIIPNDAGLDRLIDATYKQPILRLRVDQIPVIPATSVAIESSPTVEIEVDSATETSVAEVPPVIENVKKSVPSLPSDPPSTPMPVLTEKQGISSEVAQMATNVSEAPTKEPQNKNIEVVTMDPSVESQLSDLSEVVPTAIFGESSYRSVPFSFGSSGLVFRMRDQSSPFALRKEIDLPQELPQEIDKKNRATTSEIVAQSVDVQAKSQFEESPIIVPQRTPSVGVPARKLKFTTASTQINLRTDLLVSEAEVDRMYPLAVDTSKDSPIDAAVRITLKSSRPDYSLRPMADFGLATDDRLGDTLARSQPLPSSAIVGGVDRSVDGTRNLSNEALTSGNWSDPASRARDAREAGGRKSKEVASEEVENRFIVPEEKASSDPRFLPVRDAHPLVGFEEGSRMYAPGIRIGQFDVRTDLSTSATYNDNLYLNSKGRAKSSDTILAATPSIAAVSGEQDRNVTDALSVAFRYSPSVLAFVKNTNENTINHDFSANSGYRFSRLSVMLDQRMSAITGGDVERGDLVNRRFYYTTASSQYDISDRTSAELGANLNVRDYQDGFDSTEARARMYINYQLYPKIVTGLGGTYGIIQTTGGADQSYQNGLVRAVYSATEKTALYGEGGIDYRTFDSRSDASIDFVFRSGANYQYDSKTLFIADAYRRIQNSNAFFGQNITVSGISTGLIRQYFRLKLGFNVGYERSEYSSSNDSVATSRKDSYLFASPSASYALTDWWDMGMSYQYRQNDSSTSDYTFDNNQITLNSNIRF